MAENHYTREFFRQARAFENLETSFRVGKQTEKELVMAQVCNRLSKVCMMLAEMRCKEIEKKEAEGLLAAK